jgi:hypothetical protein
MGNDFRSQLESAAGELGIKANRPSEGETAKRVGPAEARKEIKQGDLVMLKPGVRFSIFKLPGGKDPGIGGPNQMGYKDKDTGFLVASLQPNQMAEIKPVRYSSSRDEGKTYLVSIVDLQKS